MGISLRWDNAEKTVIRWDCVGTWTLDEFRHSLQLSTALAGDTSHSVYGLVVIRGTCPANNVQIRQYTAHRCPANMRALVFVGANGAPGNTSAILGHRRAPVPRSVFVDTVGEAYEVITQLHLQEIDARS